jgi:hypothetical protein
MGKTTWLILWSRTARSAAEALWPPLETAMEWCEEHAPPTAGSVKMTPEAAVAICANLDSMWVHHALWGQSS